MESISADLEKIRDALVSKLYLLQHMKDSRAQAYIDLEQLKHKREVYEQAAQLFKDLSTKAQEQFHVRIMQIVTYCLREVFGEDAYEFKIIFEQKRNQVEATMVFLRGGEMFDPVSAAGGGCLDVAAFALRLAVLYMTRRSTRSVMILDEPFRYLSVEYRPKIAALLEKLATEFDFQFIMVTHIPELAIGKVFQL